MMKTLSLMDVLLECVKKVCETDVKNFIKTSQHSMEYIEKHNMFYLGRWGSVNMVTVLKGKVSKFAKQFKIECVY